MMDFRHPPWLLISASIMLVSSVAQGETTGAVNGYVVDQAGKPVSGSRVTVTSPALIGTQQTQTNDKGFYRLYGLPAGSYNVEATIPGVVKPLVRPGIVINIDSTVQVDLSEPKAGDSEADIITITERRPVVNIGSSTSQTGMSESLLSDIPAGRTTTGVLALTPGAVTDAAGTGFGGASSPENNYVIDGVNTTNVNNGLSSTNMPIEFIQDMVVKTGGFEAEYGRSTGAVVNVSTKSGGNEFHGDVWTFLTPFEASREEQTYGDDPDIAGYDNAVRLSRVQTIDADLGFDIGGPLVKDKLWFWVGGQETYRSNLYTRTIGSTEEEFGDVRLFGRYASKLTFKPVEDHILSLSFYGNPASRTGSIVTSAAGFARDDEALTGYIKTNALDGSLRWNGRFNNDQTNVELLLGYHHQVNDNGPVEGNGNSAVTHNYGYVPVDASGNPYQCENQVDEAGNISTGDCVVSGVWRSGSPGTAQEGRYDRYSAGVQFTHYLSQVLGDHKIKWGGDVELNTVLHQKSYVGGAAYTMYTPDGGPNTPGEGFDQSTSYGYDVDVGGSCDNGGTYTEYSDLFSDTGATKAVCVLDEFSSNTSTTNFAFYAQDAWSIKPNLTLNIGMRWDLQQLRDSNGNVGVGIYDNIAPRMGLIWDPSKEGKSKVYGSYGRFYESVPVGLNDRSFSAEGQYLYYEDLGGGFVYGGENSPVQKGLSGQYSDEAIIGVEFEVANDLAIGARYVHRQLGSVIEDISFDDGVTYAIANPGTTAEYTTPDSETGEQVPLANYYEEGDSCYAQYWDDDTADYGAAFEVPCYEPPTRVYDALEFTATKRWSDNWQMMASYVLSFARGNYPGLFTPENGQLDPNITSQFDIAALLPNRTGFLAQDHRHSLKVHGSYQFAKGIVTGVGFTALSGGPYSYLGRDNEHGYGNGEVFLAPRGTAGRLPADYQLDTNLGYRRALGEGRTMTLSLAAFNLLNRKTPTAVDQNWTYDGTLPVESAQGPEDFVCDADQDGTYANEECTPNVNFGQPTAYRRPFRLRVGAKFTF